MYYAHYEQKMIAYVYQDSHMRLYGDVSIDEKTYLELNGIDVPSLVIDKNKLLNAQVQAASDRSDFLEDCIAEMATLVYNTEETT